MSDIGESLVGAYLHHVEKCNIVTYNSFFSGRQGEVDVVGIQPADEQGCQTVFICEVTTHTGGMLIVRGGKNATAEVVNAKLSRLKLFAAETFPGTQYRFRFQWWSPVVAEGKLTTIFNALAEEWQEAGQSLEFVINGTYTARMRELVESARGNSSTTNEPAYRILQILTRLRGGVLGL